MRICEICGGGDLEHIHRQNFLFPGQSDPMHYDVVVCRGCGFAFASDIPSQAALNRFYQDAEHHLHTDVPEGLARIHDNFFSFIRENIELSAQTRVLDVGSGMGHFLSRFMDAGMSHLLGIEPSPAAARLGRDVYGLDIRSETVDTFDAASAFDLVSLCGVLEHIADLKTCMSRISKLVEEGGHLFIAVPDAGSFGSSLPNEAFLEFALEHIDFFTATSLDNLLRQFGFEVVKVESQYNDFYGNSYLLALYRKKAAGSVAATIEYDRVAATSLRAYVDLSCQRLQPITNMLKTLVNTGEPLVVWGAGAFTTRLFCDTCLGDTNIKVIVDRNKALHGCKLFKFPIFAPVAIKSHHNATVLIASTTYAKEIAKILKEEYEWTGRIISLLPEEIK